MIKNLQCLHGDYDLKLKKISKKYFEQHFSENPIYHYTSLESATKILTNRYFHLTSYKDMNDLNEIRYGLNSFRTIVVKNICGVEKKIVRNLINKIEDSYNIYISCFSNVPHSLPMWRFYGDGGNGIVIGIDREISAEHNKRNRAYEDFKICRVSYEDTAFQDVEDLIESLNLIMSHHSFKKKGKDEQKSFLLRPISELTRMIFNLSLLIKHRDYQIEDEVRLLLFDSVDGEYQFPKERLGCRTRKDSKAYIDQHFEIKQGETDREEQYLMSKKFQHKVIKEIWFGNKLDDTTISKFKEYLSNQGYDIKKIKFEQFVSSYR